MIIGSAEHKELFCQSFIDSYQAYEPETMPWPQLDDVALVRLRSIPFWEEALSTEQEAGMMVTAFAQTIEDPLIRQAIALQGEEETRHGRLLQFLIQHYDIPVPVRPAPQLPANIEQEFIDFGFSECLDSYFAFGIFGLARQAGYFPESLFTIFDAIVQEEARHIVFFVNWVSYLQVQQGRGWNVLRGLHSGWHYSRALLHLAKMFGSAGDGTGEGFTATSASSFMDDLTLQQFLSVTLQENAKRMQPYDKRLLQPMLLPRLSTIALKTLQLLPKRSGDRQPQLPTSEPS